MDVVGGVRLVSYARIELEKLAHSMLKKIYPEMADFDFSYIDDQEPEVVYSDLSNAGEILTSEANKIYKIIDEIRSNLF